MVLPIAVLLMVGTLAFTLLVRAQDVPAPEPVSPTQHLDERKAQIYDNLRDLQFEYRLGKLSDADYQKTKVGLQAELAKVLAEIDEIRATMPQPVPAPKPASAPKPAALKAVPKAEAAVCACPHCGATFDRQLNFCGECGKAMS